jgi:hypothetical protein
MQLIPTATDAIFSSSFFPGTLSTFSIHKTERVLTEVALDGRREGGGAGGGGEKTNFFKPGRHNF